MSEKKQKIPMAKSDPGLGAGRSVSVPIESEISTPEKMVSVKEIPIGLPVSSEEYEKLVASLQ